MSTTTHQDWSIQEISRITGTTSRTLRHYDDIGLLSPSRIAGNGYRHYDADALVRLQRILMMRDLGVGLREIAQVLDGPTTPADALRYHLRTLREEQQRLCRQISSVEKTIAALDNEGELMATDMFDGFDHTQYEEEVTQRWGAEAYRASDQWWRGMSQEERATWKERTAQLGHDWTQAAESGIDPTSETAQDLARRHVQWLTGIPGTPASGPQASPETIREYCLALGEMYVADPRFARNYGGEKGAEFVRDALAAYFA